jgi:hypothetical protein
MNIIIAGDFFGGGAVSEAMNHSIESVIDKELIRQFKIADLAILNLESPLTNHNQPINKSGPAIKAEGIVANRIKEMGISLVTLANNHIMDFGSEGLKDTLAYLEAIDLPYVGAGIKQGQSQNPHIINVSNKKLAVLNFCENEWSTIEGPDMGANPIDEIDNFYQIKKVKEQVDYVLVIAHGGHEHYSLPSPRVKKLYRFYADAGANAVVAHHTHCTSGYEVYNGVPIIYSLGNFLFANQTMHNSYWNKGMMVSLSFKSTTCTFQFTHFDQCNEQEASVKLVSEKENVLRNERITEFNQVINNDSLLNDQYQSFLSSSYRMYGAYLEPHSNRYLQFLQNMQVLPSLWSKRKKMYLLNLLRCEAHRDIITEFLKKNYNQNLR